MDNNAQARIQHLLGKPFCRIHAGAEWDLSLGFGEKVYHGNTKLNNDYYGEWELGTYYGSWRVLDGKTIICGNNDSVESVEELNLKLNEIAFGSVIALKQISSFDLRLELDSGHSVEFLATTSDDDELFHIFGPENLFIWFSLRTGWSVGKSNEPWRG